MRCCAIGYYLIWFFLLVWPFWFFIRGVPGYVLAGLHCVSFFAFIYYHHTYMFRQSINSFSLQRFHEFQVTARIVNVQDFEGEVDHFFIQFTADTTESL